MDAFEDRRDAGRQLGAALRSGPLADESRRIVVLAIPRGGVPIGAEVADALDATLDVVVVRKLRAPFNPELGFGALAADGHVEIDEDLVRRAGLTREQIDREIADRREVVAQRLEQYRSILPEPALSGAVAVVVDDGVATGGTARQACGLARRQDAQRVLFAAPVGPPHVERALAEAADEVVVLSQPADFMAVGQAYRDFTQLDDADVQRTLEQAAVARSR
jgi:putative phosphoribosyl transferase